MSSVKDAEQKYKKNLDIVHAFCKKDLSQNKRYVKKMCDLYFEDGVSFNDICSLFAVYEDNKGVFDAVGVNFNQCSYQQLFELVYRASGEYADKCKLPNEIIQSKDKTVSLGLFRTFEEAMKFDGDNSWCTSFSEGRFEENTANGTLLYIIRNLRFSKGSDCRFVVAQVFNDGTKIYWTSNDRKLTDKHEKNHPSIAEYENSINEVLPYIKPKSTNNQITKQDTNMKTENRNRNVVRLTESQLKQIVAESVKRVLSEMQNDDFSIKCLNYLEQNEYSKESISKVAILMFKNDQWTLYDGRHELLALATDQNGKLMYSFNQKAWQYVN